MCDDATILVASVVSLGSITHLSFQFQLNMFYSADNMAAASEAHGRFLSQHALRPDTLHTQ